jgi:hypothetical protein
MNENEDEEIPAEEVERLRLELIEAFAELGAEIELVPEAVVDAEMIEFELPGAQKVTLRKALSFRLKTSDD